MRTGRIIPTLIIAIILILRGGDCVPLLFANQATKDCCTKGKCGRSQKSNPCCAQSSSDGVQHFQAEERVSLDDVSLPPVALEPPLPLHFLSVMLSHAAAIDSSPPLPNGPAGRISLPLLI